MAAVPICAFDGKGLLCAAADAVHAGEVVFLSCRYGIDLNTGMVARGRSALPEQVREELFGSRYVDAVEWAITAQVWWIYEAFRRILAPLGAGLEHLVRTNTYFRSLGMFPAMERTRSAILRSNPPPSTVLSVPYRHFPRDAEIAIEATAALPVAGGREIVKAQLGSGAHYVWANSVNERIWVAGQTPAHPISEEYPRLVEDLGLEGRHLATGNRHIDRREGRVTAQAWLTYWRVQAILESAGVGLDKVVHEKIFLRSKDHIAAVERVRRQLYPRVGQAPPSTYLQVMDEGVDRDCLIEVDVIATRGDRTTHPASPDGLERLGAGACASGPFLYLGGWVARDATSGDVIHSANELGRFRSALQGGEHATTVQAACIYEKLDTFLPSCGSSLEELAKIDVYVTESADLKALDEVHRMVFPAGLPAISVVPMLEVDHDDAIRLKVSGVALRSKG